MCVSNAALLVRGFLKIPNWEFLQIFSILVISLGVIYLQMGEGGEEARSALFWRGNELKKTSGRAAR